jgi:hypothetical protein
MVIVAQSVTKRIYPLFISIYAIKNTSLFPVNASGLREDCDGIGQPIDIDVFSNAIR